MQANDERGPFPWPTMWEDLAERWEDIEFDEVPELVEERFRHLVSEGLPHLAADPDVIRELTRELAKSLTLSEDAEDALLAAAFQIAGLIRKSAYDKHFGEGAKTVPGELSKLARASRDLAATLSTMNPRHQALLNYQRRTSNTSKRPSEEFDLPWLSETIDDLAKAAEGLGPEAAKLGRGRPPGHVRRAALSRLLFAVENATGEPVAAVEGGSIDKVFRFTGRGAPYVREFLALLYPRVKERTWVKLAKEVRGQKSIGRTADTD